MPNVVITRIFDAPAQAVWEAWTVGEKVMQWWGPTGFTCPVANMDVREGGTSLVCMRAPAEYGGQDFYNTWTYTKVIPMQRLEYILRFVDEHGQNVAPAALGLPPTIPNEVLHTVIFKSMDANRTEVTVTEFGYPTTEIVELSKAGMEQCLDKMAVSLR